ncbi:hypothetical protein Gohar_010478 [Gossypium harknessii]|uniref:Uncharacterized protein n=1 Tax=Gossypium harknessii TaxID=34285 RepID=A0A7J9GR25_9ROSI|nr:hypothetical protein [Gossypium harknessii]
MMKVVSCVRGEEGRGSYCLLLASMVESIGGLRSGGLPCGGCQRFEFVYLQLQPISKELKDIRKVQDVDLRSLIEINYADEH